MPGVAVLPGRRVLVAAARAGEQLQHGAGSHHHPAQPHLQRGRVQPPGGREAAPALHLLDGLGDGGLGVQSLGVVRAGREVAVLLHEAQLQHTGEDCSTAALQATHHGAGGDGVRGHGGRCLLVAPEQAVPVGGGGGGAAADDGEVRDVVQVGEGVVGGRAAGVQGTLV